MKPAGKMAFTATLLGALALGAASPRAAGNAAQDAAAGPALQAASAAQDAQLATLDGILSALYGTISGPAGAPRDWARLRGLFAHEGKMVVHGPNKEGELQTRVMSLPDYISRVTPLFAKEGFYETELARSTERFGQIAHVFSTYESRHAEGEAPFQRGINSIQLVNDGRRWWIQSLVWQAETERNPLPARYLKGKQ